MSLRSAVQQLNPATRTIGNYTRFRFVGGHSLVAFYDLSVKDATGNAIPATLCGDVGVSLTNISTAAFPNRYRVELTTAGSHNLSAYAGSTCGTGSVLATQGVKTVQVGQTASGSAHNLALLTDGTVRAWGFNSFGELGDGTTTNSSIPVTVTGITASNPALEVAGGSAHSLALLADGTVRAWGYNLSGQLGNGTTMNSSTPMTVSGITASNPAVEVASRGFHSLALLADGTLCAWGVNYFGELGDGTTTDSSVPVMVSGITASNPAIEVASGDHHSLALLADGTVRAWGYNYYGQLGNGTITRTANSIPVTVSGITTSNPAVEVAGGDDHSLVLLSDGTVRAWGLNYYGQLGNDTTTESSIPVTVSGITASNPAVEVAGGFEHSLALLTDGTVRAWGYNAYGQLGDGTTTNSSIPVTVSGMTASNPAVEVAGGHNHSLALLADGTLRAWGENANGELGNGTTTGNSIPVTVSGITAAARPTP